MLAFFRRRMKLILWILVVVVIVTFIPWGVGVRLRMGGRAGAAGELFGKRVSLVEFEDARGAVQTQHLLFQGRTPLTPEQLKERAWERLTMLRAARMMGITVSDRELAQTVRMQFGRGGGFDQRVYENALTFVGVTPDLYEQWTRELLMILRLQQLVQNSVWIPDPQLERQFRDDETMLTIRYALYKPEDAARSVTVTPEEITRYYNEHTAEFKSPAKMLVRYLFIPWSAPKGKQAPTEKEITTYYEEHPGEFSHGKRVKARHILLKVEGKDRAKAEDTAKATAEDLLKKIRGGKDFARLARKYSGDEKTRGAGGDLGFIESGGMPQAFSDRAFAMKEGEVSDPVKTAQGYHLIKVEGFQEAGETPIAEARKNILAKLEKDNEQRAAEDAKNAAYAKAVDISLALVENKNPEEIARKYSVEARDAGPFTENDSIKEIGAGREFASAAFSTEVGSFSDIIEIPARAYCVILPKKKIEEATRSPDEAREEIAKKIREQKARGKAHEIAAAARAEATKKMKESKVDFAAACKALSIKTTETGPFKAMGPLPGLGFEPALTTAASKLADGTPSQVVDITQGSCFFAVTKREAPSAEVLAKGIEGFRRRAAMKEDRRAMIEWNKWVLEQAKHVDYTLTASYEDAPSGDVEE